MMRLLLLLLLAPLIYSEITFSVEEPALHPKGKHRHHHKHRHARDHPIAVHDLPSTRPERFEFHCPHVADADNKDVHLEVTWTLDDTVLLKIRDGEQIVHFNRSSFRRKSVDGKHTVKVELYSGRYLFNYDELTGDFMMEINEVQPFDDFGTWTCHITRRRGSENISESTRKTIVAPPGAVERRAAAAAKEKARFHATTPGYRIPDGGGSHHQTYLKARIDYGRDGDEYQTRTTQKFSAFTRPDQNSVQISRDSTDRRKQTVVFDRSSVTKEYRQHSIDYEMSMADEENDDFRYEGYKRARAAELGTNGVPTAAALPVLLAVTVAMLHHARL